MSATVLVEEIREALADHADPINGGGDARLYETEMPYRGVHEAAATQDLPRPVPASPDPGEGAMERGGARPVAERGLSRGALRGPGAGRSEAVRGLGRSTRCRCGGDGGDGRLYVDEVATHRRRASRTVPSGQAVLEPQTLHVERRSSIICQVNWGETDLALEGVAPRLRAGYRLGAALMAWTDLAVRVRARPCQPPRSAEKRNRACSMLYPQNRDLLADIPELTARATS